MEHVLCENVLCSSYVGSSRVRHVLLSPLPSPAIGGSVERPLPLRFALTQPSRHPATRYCAKRLRNRKKENCDIETYQTAVPV